ncbi:PGPGW domain-containing protein [Prosthecobacter sp. SYSU 5D2]|uniref:PGPGW domain-containing protein n=1 Tax=Prosthecobacter sp. SYSU 5D2 TaxID=3134134 RepID=UPI0031FF29EE
MPLITTIKSFWNEFKDSEPGRRFEEFYEKRQEERKGSGIWQRILYLGIGLALVAAGVAFLALPGPGLLVMALGLALMAGEFRTMARGLDQVEVGLRAAGQKLREWWQRLKPYQRVLSMAAGAVMVMAAADLLYQWVM